MYMLYKDELIRVLEPQVQATAYLIAMLDQERPAVLLVLPVSSPCRQAVQHVSITCCAALPAGKLLEAVQESPAIMCFPSDADKFSLGFSWHMQTPINCLPDDAAVFFELQHYKLAKKKVW
jgi:hypothetical protein